MTSIFISHSSADDDVASRIAEAFRQAGASVWVDRTELTAGHGIGSKISEGLTGADVFLLLYSKEAAASHWVQKEWEAALTLHVSDHDYPFVVARLDATPPPPILAGFRNVSFQEDATSGIQQLVNEVCPRERDTIWYFDDDPRWLDRFRERHTQSFVLRTFSDPAVLLGSLMRAARSDTLPDMLLMDFHTIRKGVSDADAATAENAVHRLVEEERALRSYVDAAWHPAGVDIVETVRDFYPPERLPIAMHTQQGLILLRDDLIRSLEYHNVGWLIKNRFSPETDRMVLAGIARRSGHTITREHPRALIVDDNPAYIETFVQRQGKYYEIESLLSEDEVMGKLVSLENQDRFPDIFLVDMYYPTGNETPELIDIANTKLKEFAQLEAETQRIVQAAYEPIGLNLIQQIRRIIPPRRLPIMVYTISGLVTVGDHAFREVENRGCGWLLKDRYDAETEEIMILGEMMRVHATGGVSTHY